MVSLNETTPSEAAIAATSYMTGRLPRLPSAVATSDVTGRPPRLPSAVATSYMTAAVLAGASDLVADPDASPQAWKHWLRTLPEEERRGLLLKFGHAAVEVVHLWHTLATGGRSPTLALWLLGVLYALLDLYYAIAETLPK